MNDLSQPTKDIIIKITEIENKYYVSIKPYNQVKQIFYHKEKRGIYQLIVKFLMGYLIGSTEHFSLDINKLNNIINKMNKLFTINVKLIDICK